MKNTFKEIWINETLEKMKLAYPNEDNNDLLKFIENEYETNFKDSECILYNNYEKEEVKSTINNLINWILVKKPILTESGSLFKKHNECYNPNTHILNKKLAERKVAKADKFKFMNLANKETDEAKKEEYYYLAKKADLKQNRIKVIVNSEYGVSGLPSSWFFNMACASATTAKGQALIATSFNAFEDFLSDSVTFDDMDECMTFIYNIINEKNRRKKKDSIWVKDKSVDEVTDRLLSKFTEDEDYDIKLIRNILTSLSQEDLNRIYYKSNMHEFFRNSDKAKKHLRKIINAKVSFMDPKKPDEIIKEDLDKLRSGVMEYVHYNYQFNNRLTRLKTRDRYSVIVVDTDSNFINLGPWVEFVYEEILEIDKYVKIEDRKRSAFRFVIDARNKFNRKSYLKKEQETFVIINVMCNMMDEMINNTLKDFLDRTNVPEDNPGNTSMKNEFMYPKILNTPAKKHYQAAIRLQEGNLLPFDIDVNMDIKGMEYMKPAYAGEATRNFIRNLVYNEILTTDGAPNNVEILRQLDNYEKDVIKSVLNGESKYLKTANIKTEDSYSDPMGTGSFKAAFVWNSLYPDKEIEFPGIAYIVPVDLKKPKDFARLSVVDPELFKRLMDLFENNDRIKKTGITNIAIPLDEKFPKSLEAYINFDEIMSKNLSLIIPVLNCIGIKSISRTKGSMFFSNIVEI